MSFAGFNGIKEYSIDEFIEQSGKGKKIDDTPPDKVSESRKAQNAKRAVRIIESFKPVRLREAVTYPDTPAGIDKWIDDKKKKNPQQFIDNPELEELMRDAAAHYHSKTSNFYSEFDNAPHLMGSKAETISDADITDYMKRAIARPSDKNMRGNLQKEYKKLLNKKVKSDADNERIAEIEATLRQHSRDNYNLPYLHGSNIKDENGNPISTEDLKAFITKRPKQLLTANGKIQKTGGGFEDVYNLSLPALRGIVVDEKTRTIDPETKKPSPTTGELKVIDTCPGAGKCKTVCYAKAGSYIIFKEVSAVQTRKLNFMLNDPKGFATMLHRELNGLKSKNGDDVKTVMRWHDAGDFMSPAYLALAIKIAEMNPDVLFYAYTKIANVVMSQLPDNFIINWSEGAKASEQNKINTMTTKPKHSGIIPKKEFMDLLELSKNGLPFKDANGKYQYKEGGLETLKQRVADLFKVRVNTVITVDELLAKPVGLLMKWNVIVGTGDPDDSAKRRDVLGTYLIIH